MLRQRKIVFGFVTAVYGKGFGETTGPGKRQLPPDGDAVRRPVTDIRYSHGVNRETCAGVASVPCLAKLGKNLCEEHGPLTLLKKRTPNTRRKV
jgi:hypothetical protein